VQEFITRRGLKLFTCRWLPSSTTTQDIKALVFLCHGKNPSKTIKFFLLILSLRERERERESASPHSQKSFSIATLKSIQKPKAHLNWNRKVRSGPVTYVVLSSDPVSYVDRWLFVNKPGYGGETSILMKGNFFLIKKKKKTLMKLNRKKNKKIWMPKPKKNLDFLVLH
jgi:hypothetical protein